MRLSCSSLRFALAGILFGLARADGHSVADNDQTATNAELLKEVKTLAAKLELM